MKKIVKFGGSSLANAEQRLQIYFINVIILQLKGRISYRSCRKSREDIMRLSAD